MGVLIAGDDSRFERESFFYWLVVLCHRDRARPWGIVVVDRPGRIILTNDDGIDAPGLAALRVASSHLADRLVYAPSGPRSGCGHQVTTHAPISCVGRAEGEVAVAGTPADCVRVAIHHLGAAEIAWVLSGVNAGGNLGTDVYHSGTVAAVREAALRGIPGIALSHYIARGRALDWDQAARWTTRVLRTLMARPHRPGTFWAVNLPHPAPGAPEPELVFCPLDPNPLPLGFRDDEGGLRYFAEYQSRARDPGGDVAVCFGGQIAVCLVPIMASIWPVDPA